MSEEILRLSFCGIRKIDDYTVEVISDYGVEVGAAEIKEYHAFFDTLPHPVGLLVNRVNDYSYSFDAQAKVATHKNMAAVAILVLEPEKKPAAEFDVSVIEYKSPMQIFTNRSEALSWLNSHTSS
jgi:hypothetical protein